MGKIQLNAPNSEDISYLEVHMTSINVHVALNEFRSNITFTVQQIIPESVPACAMNVNILTFLPH